MPVSYYIVQILRYLHGSYKPDSIYTFSSIGRQADRLVAEVNNGGDVVENTLRMVDRNVSYGRVWASKGKFVRAEPVSSLYHPT